MSISTKLIGKTSIQPMIWDGGETFEYFIFPDDTSYLQKDFQIRVSRATIAKSPSLFTQFDYYQRYLVMLDNDLKIVRNEISEQYLRHQVFKFASKEKILSYSLGNDFNLMLSDDLSPAKVIVEQNLQTQNNGFVFAFALETCRLKINETIYQLESYDLLVIQNKSRDFIDITSDKKLIIALVQI